MDRNNGGHRLASDQFKSATESLNTAGAGEFAFGKDTDDLALFECAGGSADAFFGTPIRDGDGFEQTENCAEDG